LAEQVIRQIQCRSHRSIFASKRFYVNRSARSGWRPEDGPEAFTDALGLIRQHIAQGGVTLPLRPVLKAVPFAQVLDPYDDFVAHSLKAESRK
jgi:hypothetical protein